MSLVKKKGASCPILSKRRDRMCHRRLRIFALKATGAILGLHGLRALGPLRDGVRKRVPKAQHAPRFTSDPQGLYKHAKLTDNDLTAHS